MPTAAAATAAAAAHLACRRASLLLCKKCFKTPLLSFVSDCSSAVSSNSISSPESGWASCSSSSGNSSKDCVHGQNERSRIKTAAATWTLKLLQQQGAVDTAVAATAAAAKAAATAAIPPAPGRGLVQPQLWGRSWQQQPAALLLQSCLQLSPSRLQPCSSSSSSSNSKTTHSCKCFAHIHWRTKP
ncbi:hypothetical protein ETH_00029890 [Eimeria tenella]|uniref:Uncharacterized protein n=1 Tax=Eimeria tenella TaxID=5802 RepID=U6KK08_EIMTE|nr:hypothetical protein ETH_00029890 [Eimeria tenella]CDJ38269.1 hypothetical protein ETH_00029890 [Eimeria tenella]|eukprot:XP_013229107.1 hypothetical protein ETH_00029890 [Eimeria tenella]